MKLRTNLSRLLRRFIHREDAAIAPIVGVMLPVMFGMLGLVEAGRVYGVKNQLQATADAAAMASVRQLPNEQVDPGIVERTAIDFADYNMPPAEQYGETAVLIDADVEKGTWDGADDVGDSGDPPNAVKVTTRGEMGLFFAGALRSLGVGAPGSFKPSAKAIARLRLDKCYENGFVAGGMIEMNSSNTFDGGFCVYGRNGVTMNNSNEFAPGTGVGMLDLDHLDEGGNNPGLQNALLQKDIAAPPISRAAQLIDDLTAGFDPIPDYITNTPPPSNTLPSYLVPGTMYIYTGTANITLDDLENVAIVSHNASLTIKAGSHLRSVLLASAEAVDISSNVEIGDEDYCDTGEGASLIISGGAVTDKKSVSVGANSNIKLHGVQIVAEGTMEMNSNLVITGASVQATDDIVFNSSFDVDGCHDKSPNVTREGTKVAQLVD